MIRKEEEELWTDETDKEDKREIAEQLTFMFITRDKVFKKRRYMRKQKVV